MAEENKFWMVYCAGGKYPRKVHHSQEEAFAEAERIAKKDQCQVYVLAPIAVCRRKETPVEWEDIN